MEYLVESTNAKSRKFLSHLMPSYISQLKLERSKRAVLVMISDSDLPEGNEGGTIHIDVADCYMVMIKLPKRITTASLLNMAGTLAHEMVHVSQLAKGQLVFGRGQVRTWMGKRYTKKTKYLDQPWEIDALSRQELLLRRAIE